MNGATCENEFDDFKCACANNYEGNRCEKKISNCYEVKCFNGGYCDEKTGKCSCITDFTGEKCEIKPNKTNPCSSNPCIKGVCSYVQNGYKCYCLPDYTGFFSFNLQKIQNLI